MSEWELIIPEGYVFTTFTRPNEDGSITFRELLRFKDGAHMKEFYDTPHEPLC